MRIKVFREETTKEAMDKVKEEFGPDAVILHTKKYKKGGFLGYGSKHVVEVTAAIEDTPPRQRLLPPLPPLEPQEKEKEFLPQAKPVVPRQVLNNYKSSSALPPLEEQKEQDKKEEQLLQEAEKAAPEEAFAPLDAAKLSEEKSSVTAKEAEQEKHIKQLQHELDQMKIMLEHMVHDKAAKNEELSITTLKDALVKQEVEDIFIDEVLAALGQEKGLLPKESLEAKELLTEFIKSRMNGSCGIEIEQGKPKMVALIGATGVGKTTTLAKIASRFVLEQGLRAVLITADTYRISAVDQLKTYSDIIGLPLEVVYAPNELKKAIDRHRDKQLILIDTAGRSQHNDYQLNELHDLLSVNEGIEKHLVLSATTKYKDLIDIIRKFSFCAPDKIIFTKTDETCCIGMILNLLLKYPITLSYFTNGQSVPDDIFPASADNLAELLLR